MPDFTVARRGTDTSGRGIWMTAFMWLVWAAMLTDPRLAAFRSRIVVVQGPFMVRNGGGATASAGYHDLAGCIDIRTWNLTLAEQATFWTVAAEYGFWFWKRDTPTHMGGMDEHGHSISGWDQPLAPGAANQWTQAKAGRDGLAGNGPDYMRREGPLVLFPPAHLLQEDYMATDDAQRKLDQILDAIGDLDKGLDAFRSAELQRDRAAASKAKEVARRQIATLGGLADALTELAGVDDIAQLRRSIRQLRQTVLTALADDPDVDGPDNPAPAATDA